VSPFCSSGFPPLLRFILSFPFPGSWRQGGGCDGTSLWESLSWALSRAEAVSWWVGSHGHSLIGQAKPGHHKGAKAFAILWASCMRPKMEEKAPDRGNLVHRRYVHRSTYTHTMIWQNFYINVWWTQLCPPKIHVSMPV
jgi:hypothetical protein